MYYLYLVITHLYSKAVSQVIHVKLKTNGTDYPHEPLSDHLHIPLGPDENLACVW